eukprot:6507284-Pyramimonas_sp.AAC.1
MRRRGAYLLRRLADHRGARPISHQLQAFQRRPRRGRRPVVEVLIGEELRRIVGRQVALPAVA